MTDKPDSPEWKKFFDSHAPIYMDNVFTKNAEAEVDFVVRELKLKPGDSIIDVGCGTGRHSVELARRGFRMTGVDLSSGMLAQAAQAAQIAGVDIELIECDAVEFRLDRTFDAALCLCEGAFCLLGRDDDSLDRDFLILENIHRLLKPGGGFILTTLSALRMIRLYSADDIAAGKFDPISMVETSTEEYGPKDDRRAVSLRERAYVPTELRAMFRRAGFEIDYIGGGTAGNWGRRMLDPDEYEIMVIARKRG